MPHIMIEYSQPSLSEEGVENLVDEAFQAVNGTDLFSEANIKVRLHPVVHYRLGLPDCGFMHVQCRIHQGKTQEQKQRLTQALLWAIQNTIDAPVVITAEVQEMERATYAKTVLSTD